eukprot:m.69643 g.69643  ORF g.69643 m.69643 type:complete len:481 (+) comp12234_c3_seq1:122-1564(+)
MSLLVAYHTILFNVIFVLLPIMSKCIKWGTIVVLVALCGGLLGCFNTVVSAATALYRRAKWRWLLLLLLLIPLTFRGSGYTAPVRSAPPRDDAIELSSVEQMIATLSQNIISTNTDTQAQLDALAKAQADVKAQIQAAAVAAPEPQQQQCMSEQQVIGLVVQAMADHMPAPPPPPSTPALPDLSVSFDALHQRLEHMTQNIGAISSTLNASIAQQFLRFQQLTQNHTQQFTLQIANNATDASSVTQRLDANMSSILVTLLNQGHTASSDNSSAVLEMMLRNLTAIVQNLPTPAPPSVIHHDQTVVHDVKDKTAFGARVVMDGLVSSALSLFFPSQRSILQRDYRPNMCWQVPSTPPSASNVVIELSDRVRLDAIVITHPNHDMDRAPRLLSVAVMQVDKDSRLPTVRKVLLDRVEFVNKSTQESTEQSPQHQDTDVVEQSFDFPQEIAADRTTQFVQVTFHPRKSGSICVYNIKFQGVVV